MLGIPILNLLLIVFKKTKLTQNLVVSILFFLKSKGGYLIYLPVVVLSDSCLFP